MNTEDQTPPWGQPRIGIAHRDEAAGESGPRFTRGVWRWIGFFIALVALVTAVLWQRCGLKGCPDVAKLRGYMPDEASVIVDRDGEEATKLYVTRRVVVPLDSIPEDVRNAFIAIEDRRFWEHGGVDWLRVVGAFWKNIKAMGIEEGSSTITMQLARNVFPDKLPANEKTVWRKLGEARVAKDIEAAYSKEEILELYLNQIYFGSGAYGIEAAAQEYFGKPAIDLDLSEAALLAALPRAPSRYNPRSNGEAALEGRTLVLERMVQQGFITAQEAAEAREEGLGLREGRVDSEAAPYFVEAVRRELEEAFGEALYTGGFTIHTTLDLDAQRVLEKELEQQLRAIEGGTYGRFPYPTYASVHEDSLDLAQGTPYLQGAAIVMEAHTGDVLALVGGRDFQESQYNRATQAMRQPGSAFKPFVYAAALGAGVPATHRVADQPIRMALDNRRYWEPKNYDGTYSGEVTLREGLVRSKNVVTVRLANEIGITRAVALAEEMGVAPRLPSNPSVVLGTAEVTPLNLTAAYAAFATLGYRPEPRFVTRVTDRNGRTVWAHEPSVRRVLDPAIAFITTSILEDVVNRGTGTAVRAVGFDGPAAGKTGTTQDAADIWFVGYTPEYVGTFWLGFDKKKTVVRGATGGELAAPVWGRVMKRLRVGGEEWTPPAGVEERAVDQFGNVIADNCTGYSQTRREYFVLGSAPMATCYPDYYYTYYDSLNAYYDSLGYAADSTTDSLNTNNWWQRFRSRIFRRPPPDTVTDSMRLRWLDSMRTRWDTLRPRVDTMIRRDTIRPDTLRRDTVLRDSLRRDSIIRVRFPRPIPPRKPIRRDTIRRDTTSTTISSR
jgi:penicillin-binding protein 1A